MVELEKKIENSDISSKDLYCVDSDDNMNVDDILNEDDDFDEPILTNTFKPPRIKTKEILSPKLLKGSILNEKDSGSFAPNEDNNRNWNDSLKNSNIYDSRNVNFN